LRCPPSTRSSIFPARIPPAVAPAAGPLGFWRLCPQPLSAVCLPTMRSRRLSARKPFPLCAAERKILAQICPGRAPSESSAWHGRLHLARPSGQ
jgi:hypothetical protein